MSHNQVPRGGKRKGAGRKTTWNSSATRKGTKSIRVPKKIANKVMKLAHILDNCLFGEAPESHDATRDRAQTILALYRITLEDKNIENDVCGNSADREAINKAIALLNEGLKLKANAGGKIKIKVREAIALLKEET